MFHGCAVMVQHPNERFSLVDDNEYAKIALYVDEQQCLKYGFAYLIAHEAMHLLYKDMEFIYQLTGQIQNSTFMRYLRAIELRADMTTLDKRHCFLNHDDRKKIIEQALRMHVQRLPKVSELKNNTSLWDMQLLESTHPSALKRFAYFLRAKQLMDKQK